MVEKCQNIIPTFISTDLITPGKPKRDTLPGIGTCDKRKGEWKLWGQDTKLTDKGELLAYHHFKPSHLVPGKNNSKVVVTHRHFGSRTYNVVTSKQPYDVTNLLMSKCRINDQRMPQPFQSSLVHQHYIPEPYSKEFCNSYCSHRCKFQVFPTNGVDLIDAETVSINVPSKFKLQERTKAALNELHRRYYGTTTYNTFHEKPYKKKKRRNSVKFNIPVSKCQICKKEIKTNAKESTQQAREKYDSFHWPLETEESKPKPLNSCIDSQESENEFCSCNGKVPVVISSIVVTPSQENLLGNSKRSKRRKTPGITLHSDHEKPKAITKFQRGFKTEARHKFLKTYQEIIPNLSDAVREGKKHDFFGWNVNFFRG